MKKTFIKKCYLWIFFILYTLRFFSRFDNSCKMKFFPWRGGGYKILKVVWKSKNDRNVLHFDLEINIPPEFRFYNIENTECHVFIIFCWSAEKFWISSICSLLGLLLVLSRYSKIKINDISTINNHFLRKSRETFFSKGYWKQKIYRQIFPTLMLRNWLFGILEIKSSFFWFILEKKIE